VTILKANAARYRAAPHSETTASEGTDGSLAG
jgi:hypothetical protein